MLLSMIRGTFSSILIFAALLPAYASAAWTPTNGPAGPRILGMAVDGADLHIIHSTGASLSRNGGETWEDYESWLDFKYGIPTSLAARNGAVYLGSSRGVWARAGESSPFLRVNTGLTDTAVMTLCFAGDALLAGTLEGGIYRSRDKGAHWTRITPVSLTGPIVGVAASGLMIFAATESGFYRSLDDGATWSRSDPDAKDTVMVGVSRNEEFLFARSLYALYCSADNGAHWIQLDPGVENPAFYSFNAVGNRLFAMNNEDGLFRSPDNGMTWTRDSSFFNERNTSFVSDILPLGNALFAATVHGVYRSGDQGATWNGVNTGLGSGPALAMAEFGPGRLLTATHEGLYATRDSGSHWTYLSSKAKFKSIPNMVFALGQFAITVLEHDQLFRSSDLGNTWEKWTPWPGGKFSGFSVVGGDLFLNSDTGGFFRSQDSGRTWQSMKDGVTLGIRSLAKTKAGLFGGTALGVAKFDSAEGTWKLVPSNNPPLGIDRLAATGDTLFAGKYLDGLYRSTDGGATWTHTLDGNSVSHLMGLLIYKDAVFAASDSGITLSRDKGVTWTAVNEGLPPLHPVVSMHIQDGFLFVGAGGIWKRSLSDWGLNSIAPRSARSRAHSPSRGFHQARGRIAFTPVGEEKTARLRDALGKNLPD